MELAFVLLDTSMSIAPNAWSVKTSAAVAEFASMAFASALLDTKEMIVLRKSLSPARLVLTIALSEANAPVECVSATPATVASSVLKWMPAIVEQSSIVLEMDAAKMDNASVTLAGPEQVAARKSNAQTIVRITANANGVRAGATSITLRTIALNRMARFPDPMRVCRPRTVSSSQWAPLCLAVLLALFGSCCTSRESEHNCVRSCNRLINSPSQQATLV